MLTEVTWDINKQLVWLDMSTLEEAPLNTSHGPDTSKVVPLKRESKNPVKGS
jgi:hypothetical protein